MNTLNTFLALFDVFGISALIGVRVAQWIGGEQ